MNAMVRAAATTSFVVLATAAWAEGRCPSFTGREWEFTGHLVNEVSPGPPDFESLSGGDKPLTRWYVQLPWPACFEEYRHLSSLQLDLNLGQVNDYRKFLGKEIRVLGKLEEGKAGHHTTALVVKVSSLVRVRRDRGGLHEQ